MKTYDFLGKRKAFGVVSAVLVLLSIAYIAIFNVKKNVDFEGGTTLTVAFRDTVSIESLRSQLNSVEPSAILVEQKVDAGSRFALKIKNPDVEKGEEAKASLERLRRLQNVFALLNNEDKAVIDAVKNADEAALTTKLNTENIYSIVDSDAKRQEIYQGLAKNLIASAATATTVDQLAELADSAKKDDLAIAISSVLYPAIDHTTKDALGAALVKNDPLGRGAQANYSDVVNVFEAHRTANHDFVAGFEQIGFGADMAAVKDFLSSNYVMSNYRVVSTATFSPSIAAEMLRHAESAIFLALIGILLYIAIRFDANYAVASVVALSHDVIIALGIFAISGAELSNPVVAAFLTIVGYSLNDTIVVFDRIRDNRGEVKSSDLQGLMNTSINQTLSRTVVTSLTTFFVVAVIFFFSNNASLEDFAFPLLIGIVVGTYSSIFVASPVLLYLTESNTLSKLTAALWSPFKGSAAGKA